MIAEIGIMAMPFAQVVQAIGCVRELALMSPGG